MALDSPVPKSKIVKMSQGWLKVLFHKIKDGCKTTWLKYAKSALSRAMRGPCSVNLVGLRFAFSSYRLSLDIVCVYLPLPQLGQCSDYPKSDIVQRTSPSPLPAPTRARFVHWLSQCVLAAGCRWSTRRAAEFYLKVQFEIEAFNATVMMLLLLLNCNDFGLSCSHLHMLRPRTVVSDSVTKICCE